MRLSLVELSVEIRFRWGPFNLRSIFNSNNYFPFPAGSPKNRLYVARCRAQGGIVLAHFP